MEVNEDESLLVHKSLYTALSKPPSGKRLHVADIPGHPSLRGNLVREWAQRIGALVVVMDASDMRKDQLTDTAALSILIKKNLLLEGLDCYLSIHLCLLLLFTLVIFFFFFYYR